MERIELSVRDNDGNGKARLSYGEEGGVCRVQLDHKCITLFGNGSDFFDVLCAVRQHLEERAAELDCYGAGPNAFPSGMPWDAERGL